jgi:hypothetical protein
MGPRLELYLIARPAERSDHREEPRGRRFFALLCCLMRPQRPFFFSFFQGRTRRTAENRYGRRDFPADRRSELSAGDKKRRRKKRFLHECAEETATRTTKGCLAAHILKNTITGFICLKYIVSNVFPNIFSFLRKMKLQKFDK